MKIDKYFFILIIFVIVSCSSKDQYIIYPNKNYQNTNSLENFYEIELYFDDKSVKEEFEEVAIVATDMYYYGNFFFDTVFMKMLEKKVNSIGGNGIIYEKNKKDFPNYDKEYLYFRVINIKKD